MDDVLNFLKEHWDKIIPWAVAVAVAIVGFFRSPVRQFDRERRSALRVLQRSESLGLGASDQQRQEVDDQLREAADSILTYAADPSFTIRMYCRWKELDLEGAAASLRALRRPVFFLDGNVDHQRLKADGVRACLGAIKGMTSSRINEARESARRSAVAVAASYGLDVGSNQSTAMRIFSVAMSHVFTVWDVRWAALEDFFRLVLARKLDAIPHEYLNTRPRPEVIMPSLQAIPLTQDKPVLQELWGNLIASEMDERSVEGVLPSFAEILKELSPDEAKILDAIRLDETVPIVRIQREFWNGQQRLGGRDVEKNLSLIGFKAQCQHPTQAPTYLDNLARLRLIEFHTPGTSYANQSVYNQVEQTPDIQKLLLKYHQPPTITAKFIRTGLELTELGRSFIKACIEPK